MKPLVSIIIPVYNRAKDLPRAVESVTSQTYDNWEIVICDDGSTDNSLEVIKSLQDQGVRIKLVEHRENKGAAEARNSAMKNASGKYLAFLDSDDEWLPEKLKIQVDLMEQSSEDVGICFMGAEIIKNQMRSAYDIPAKSWETNTLYKFVSGKVVFTTSTIMFRRSCLEKAGYMSLVLRRGQDADWILRVLMNYKLLTIPDVMVKMHLITVQKKTAEHIITKANYMISEYGSMLKDNFGKRYATALKLTLYSNIEEAMLREHVYAGALRYGGMMLFTAPLKSLAYCRILIKAFLHGLIHW